MTTAPPGRQIALDALLAEYEALDVLKLLRAQSPLVPPSGPRDAPVMLVGEAPGQQEAARGVPFTGPAGQLLDTLLRAAQIPRSMCYVTNAVLYRPPGNRTPQEWEIVASQRRLWSEIQVVRPVVVVALGAVAWRALRPKVLEAPREMRLADERGRWRRLAVGSHVADYLVTWHPSAALRGGDAERELPAHLSTIMHREDS